MVELFKMLDDHRELFLYMGSYKHDMAKPSTLWTDLHDWYRMGTFLQGGWGERVAMCVGVLHMQAFHRAWAYMEANGYRV